MLKLYNQSHVYQGMLTQLKNYCIESEAASGDKTLKCTVADPGADIRTEYYLRNETDEFVIKEVSIDTNGQPVISAALNLEALEAKAWKSFMVTNVTIAAAAQTAITGTGWTIDTSNVTKKRNVGLVKKSALGVINGLCTAFMCEVEYDTINKKISFYEEKGEDKGVYFMSGLNLKKLSKKSSTYDFYTRIIPYGADDLDIKSVNNNVEYVENYQYSSKVRTYIWVDTNYTDAAALMADAQAKLADMSRPEVSYSADVRDLASMNPDYSLLSYVAGDTITLIDGSTGTKEKQRIVKLTEYPNEPDRNTCELSNTVLTWEEMSRRLSEAAAIVDAVIASDGQYTGTISVSDILHFEDGLENSTYLGGYIQATDGRIAAIELITGSLETNYLKADMANIATATIDKASVADLFVEIGFLASATVLNGKITGYLDAVEVNAANITAGTLVADRIAIRGATTSLVYALNNYGQITSSEVNTLDGYVLTPRTINADKIIAGTITGNEIAASTITAGKLNVISLSTITADIGTLNTGALQTSDYSYSSGNFSTAGMKIDLTNKLIRTPKFAVNASGKLFASGAEISGEISATSGTIGNGTNKITIGTDGTNASLYYGMSSLASTTAAGFYIGTDGIALGGGKFKITSAGVLTATDADVTGSVTTNTITVKDQITFLATTAHATSTTAAMRYYFDSWLPYATGQSTIPSGYYSRFVLNTLLYCTGRIYTTGDLETEGILRAVGGAYLKDNATISRSSGQTKITVQRSDTNAGVWLGIGSGGASHGVYSDVLSDWIAYSDGTDAFIRNYGGSYGSPITSYNGDGYRVSYMRAYTSSLKIYAQWNGGSGASYSAKDASVSGSDIRLKENVKDSNIKALDLVNSIKVRSFDWKDSNEYRHWPIGMVADEIEELDPRLTLGGGYEDDGKTMYIKSVNTFYLIGYLVKAIQELSDTVDRLSSKAKGGGMI